jgi:hypothetical protein
MENGALCDSRPCTKMGDSSPCLLGCYGYDPDRNKTSCAGCGYCGGGCDRVLPLCTPCGCNGGPCYLLDGRHGMTFGLDGDWSLKLISCGADGEKNDLGVCALCCSWGASPPRPLAAPSLCPLSDTDRAPLTTPPLLLACNKTSFSCKLQNFFIEWVMVCCWFVVHENVLQSCHGYPVIHGSWCLEFLRGMS